MSATLLQKLKLSLLLQVVSLSVNIFVLLFTFHQQPLKLYVTLWFLCFCTIRCQ